MKTKAFMGLLLAVGICRASAALYTEAFNNVNRAIPDANPVGISFHGLVNDIPSGYTVGGLTVGLTVSGGYNGDLYSYLVAPSGTMVVLLNRPGVTTGNPFGYGGSGLNVSLYDSASTSIQTTPETAGLLFSGNYQAAGSLANMNGSLANGTWTLYFADLSTGGGQATLNGWSLELSAVPEPANVALGVFGLIFVAFNVFRFCGQRKSG